MKAQVEKVDFKNWNKILQERNEGNKTRYYEKRFVSIPESEKDDILNRFADLTEVEFVYQGAESKGKSAGRCFIAIKATEVEEYEVQRSYDRYSNKFTRNPGDSTVISTRKVWDVIVRFTSYDDHTEKKLLTPDNTNMEYQIPGYGATAAMAKVITNDNYCSLYRLKGMIAPASKEFIENTLKTQVLKDKYGVQIEVGDFVAHPSGSYGGGSYVSIIQVKELTPGRVNGLVPERLIVVRTSNPNKKLGW